MTCANVCGCNMCAYECLVGVSVTCVHDRCERESVCGRAMCVCAGLGTKSEKLTEGQRKRASVTFSKQLVNIKGKSVDPHCVNRKKFSHRFEVFQNSQQNEYVEGNILY